MNRYLCIGTGSSPYRYFWGGLKACFLVCLRSESPSMLLTCWPGRPCLCLARAWHQKLRDVHGSLACRSTCGRCSGFLCFGSFLGHVVTHRIRSVFILEVRIFHISTYFLQKACAIALCLPTDISTPENFFSPKGNLSHSFLPPTSL